VTQAGITNLAISEQAADMANNHAHRISVGICRRTPALCIWRSSLTLSVSAPTSTTSPRRFCSRIGVGAREGLPPGRTQCVRG
jgi:hypothetical protein